ncbi:MAG: methionyl-tRNA formyltransferase [Candidatus Muproteobacteria bacterium RBG_16_64_11]|uniref:Methionyl-tRNA formyltransferase n=1 Tax=Candidatus Muproteobacteria bacterium RBG_16_64_11 TaxID=1817758 RepID=A0A1F6T998_9PROT|nr:MAG: methionyl-tRNA formyltransferase [Candidatus Muproteobacteria bacterium RBG_16_64_11]
MNLVFAGTPEFAVPTLQALHAAGHSIRAVYTQPDRPAGRGRKLTASPVKQYAQAHGLPVHQPVTLKTAAETEQLRALAPDVMIVVAYGLILPAAILAVPRHGCLNVHASLLPRWRGAAPIPRAIEAGDRASGVTIMQMDAGLDTGAILALAETPIADTDTARSLHDRLAPLGAVTLLPVLAQLARGAVEARPQDDTLACYAGKLRKDEARIDWQQPALVIHRKIRAFNPWPVAATTLRGTPLRLWGVGPLGDAPSSTAAPGTVLNADARGIGVQTGAGTVTLTHVQIEGGKVLAAADFLNGHALAAGDRLGIQA